ncbi:MAG: hypothetical protein HYZ74_06190, partial [Elusimicrobia bacterium]|nr:hypothetical protein [Elusimicrobiota bacterium]
YHLYAILADTYKNVLKAPEKSLEPFGRMLAFPNISAIDQCEIHLARAEAYASLSRPGEALKDVELGAQVCSRPADLAAMAEIRRTLGAPPP